MIQQPWMVWLIHLTMISISSPCSPLWCQAGLPLQCSPPGLHSGLPFLVCWVFWSCVVLLTVFNCFLFSAGSVHVRREALWKERMLQHLQRFNALVWIQVQHLFDEVYSDVFEMASSPEGCQGCLAQVFGLAVWQPILQANSCDVFFSSALHIHVFG